MAGGRRNGSQATRIAGWHDGLAQFKHTSVFGHFCKSAKSVKIRDTLDVECSGSRVF
jgi:hypothetical protein